MKYNLTEPCRSCPWRLNAPAGWLGANSPEGYSDELLKDGPLPCHMSVDYEDPAWEHKQFDAESCAGAAAVRANTGKLPRDPKEAAYVKKIGASDNIFTSVHDFIKHHNSSKVRSWS